MLQSFLEAVERLPGTLSSTPVSTEKATCHKSVSGKNKRKITDLEPASNRHKTCSSIDSQQLVVRMEEWITRQPNAIKRIIELGRDLKDILQITVSGLIFFSVNLNLIKSKSIYVNLICII